MRPAPEMVVEWVDDEAVVLDPATGKLHYLNPGAALVYALILEHGVEEAVAELGRRGAEEDGAIEALLDDMKQRGLLLDD